MVMCDRHAEKLPWEPRKCGSNVQCDVCFFAGTVTQAVTPVIADANNQSTPNGTVRSYNREVEHVSAYSHSNGWVRVGGTCCDERVGIGKICRGQGDCNYRRGSVRMAQRSRIESGPAAGTR